MNYIEIVDLIKDKCVNHFFINQFGYGNISDINTPEDEQPPLYPYAFLNPVNVSQNEKNSVVSFNLILMTQTFNTETDELREQSNCMEYIKQIISSVNMSLDNPLVEFVLPFSITPFKERFSDDVVGATANISITYPSGLNDCNSPY